ncbi:MAG: sulfatase [Acidobacteriota bacterium]
MPPLSRRPSPLHRCFVLGLVALALGCSPSDDGDEHTSGVPQEPVRTALPDSTLDTPRHVVLISIDTLNASALASYGGDADRQPHLDALAEHGTVFVDALSPASWTLPAHASMLTGLYPEHHGATAPNLAIASEQPKLAECFQQAGYQTVGLVDGGYMKGPHGFSDGFELWDDRGEVRRNHHVAEKGDPFHRARRFIDSRDDDRPLFLFVQTYLVHDYLHFRPWAATEQDHDDAGRERLGCLLGEMECAAEFWTAVQRVYAAEVRQVDRMLGRFLEKLEDQGLLSETLVVFTSDHGEGFDNVLKRLHHGGRLHGDQLRVPMIFAGPGVRSAAIEGPVSLVDLAPTLDDFVGLGCSDEAAPLDGVSLAPTLRGETAAPDARTIFAYESYYYTEDGARKKRGRKRRDWVLRAAVDDASWLIERRGAPYELYRFDDRDQLEPRATLDDGTEELARRLGTREPAELPVLTIRETAALRAELEALGYL